MKTKDILDSCKKDNNYDKLHEAIFSFACENDLDDISGKEFDEKFKEQFKEVPKKELVQWADDFQTFLWDNRTFDADGERLRILNMYSPY
jgi:hypothetical protein